MNETICDIRHRMLVAQVRRLENRLDAHTDAHADADATILRPRYDEQDLGRQLCEMFRDIAAYLQSGGPHVETETWARRLTPIARIEAAKELFCLALRIEPTFKEAAAPASCSACADADGHCSDCPAGNPS